MFVQWWRQATKRLRQPVPKLPKIKTNRVRLGVENLEERVVPVTSPLDTTFGVGGLVAKDIAGHTNTVGDATVVQPDGKILVAGGDSTNMTITRFNVNGTLDTTFGTNGIVAVKYGSFSEQANAIALQPDGKIVIAGDNGFSWFVARFNTNGSPDDGLGHDTTPGDKFGLNNGFATIDLGGIAEVATSIVIEPDGKIVVGGQKSGANDFCLVRWNADGSLDDGTASDTTHGDVFGTLGIVTTNLAGNDEINALAFDSSNHIVAAGQSNNDVALARYNLDGSLDTTFGVGGTVIQSLSAGVDFASAMTIQSDGKILVAGTANSTSNTGDFALARFNTNGSLDDGTVNDSNPADKFGASGSVIIDFAGQVDTATGVLILNNMIYATGTANSEFAVARMDTAGNLDPTFGNNGLIATDFLGSTDTCNAAVVYSSTQILLAGTTTGSTTGMDIALARYNVNGPLAPAPLDSTFGTNGIVAKDIAGHTNTFGDAAAVLANGQILVAGGDGTNMTVSRFNVNGTLDVTFGVNGVASVKPGAFNVQANAIAVQPDGKIVLAGNDGFVWYVVRFNGDGTLDDGTVNDTTIGDKFGAAGFVTALSGLSNVATSVVIQPDGKIVVGGQINSGSDFCLIRWNADGTLDDGTVNDTTVGDHFGTAGIVTTNLAGNDKINAIALDGNGHIVAAGQSVNDVALVRYNVVDGSIDTTFGTNGKMITSLVSGVDSANAILIQADGKILIAGTANNASTLNDFALARFNSNGSLDDGTANDSTPGDKFGPAGSVIVDFATKSDIATGVVIMGNHIYATGTANNEFAIVRTDLAGNLDTSFGNNGRLTTDFLASNDNSTGAVVYSSEQLLLLGTTVGSTTGQDIALARYVVEPAKVTGVTSPLASGSYGAGTVISITITFSAVVTVTGTPQLLLNDGGGVANYVSGSGTATLTFTYTLTLGQNAYPLDYASTTALTLNGGTIKDSLGTNVALTLATPGTAGSLSASKTFAFVTTPIEIDGDAKVQPLTDGILILRYLFSFTGTTLTSGALGAGATRTDPVAIKSYLDSARTVLDVDGNGTADPLTDGILILRYLFGFTGTALTAGALGAGATRTDPAVIQAYLDAFNPSAGHLFADSEGPGTSGDVLTNAELQAVRAAAIARWEATDIDMTQRAKLESAQVQLVDLGGTGLGETYANAVLIDRTAAGYGWFIDTTPLDDAEFPNAAGGSELQAGSGSPAGGRMDLLTVVMHELGLVMGLNDIDPSVQAHSLMTDVLGTGVRRMPTSS